MFVSCQMEMVNPNDVTKPQENLSELHFVVKARQDAETKTLTTANGDGTYSTIWKSGDVLGAFLGSTTITNSIGAVDFTLENTAADGAVGVFEGSTVAAGSGTFQAFYPASAFEKGYNDGGIGLNIGASSDYIQYPSVGSPDPAGDVLLSKACDYESDGTDVVIDDLYFIRPLSVLKINLKGSYANGEEVSWLKFSVSTGTLSGRVNLNPETAEINSWPVAKQYAWAEYSSSKPVINHATDNTVYLVVNPCTLTTGTKVTVTGETAHLNINKSFDLIADMTFPAGNIAVLNLTINAADCSLKASEDYALVTTSGAFEAGAKYVFAFKDGDDGHYVFINNNGSGTSGSPNIESEAMTVAAGVISSPNSKYVFTAETGTVSGTFKFKNSGDNYIYNSGSNTTLNTNSGSSADWFPTFLSDSKTYKLQVGSSSGRYMSYGANTYSAKAYDPANNAFIDQVDNGSALAQCSGAISVFKYLDTRTPLATPTNLAVSDMTVTWDAVANAGSYTVTIDGTDYVAGANSYLYTGVAGYLDVEVVAHPTLAGVDTYKDSDAAILSNATFGTPTLNTPVLADGGFTGTSVTVTWTDDPNATAGYHCEIYNGLSKVNETDIAAGIESVTFSGLMSGTEYTVKVNAKAVTGSYPWVASAVASIVMTPDGQTVSSVTAAGSYNIPDLTVMAVNGNNVILADATGAILLYKSSHGLSVGDVRTVNGYTKLYHGVYEFYTDGSHDLSITGSTSTTPAYPSPVTYDASKITSYSSSPVTEYATATGVANSEAKTITVADGKVLNVFGSLASVDGRTVVVNGYAFGYNSSKVDFMPVGSPSIDESVPYLATSPASSSTVEWDDDEYGVGNAKTITISLNGAATGYTVSSGTSAWTVSDNGSGTISVYPNAANASTTEDKTLDVIITHKDNPLLTSTVTLKQNQKGAPATKDYYRLITSLGDITAGTYVVGALRSASATDDFYFGKATVSSGDWVVSDDSITVEAEGGIRRFETKDLPSGAVEFTFTGNNTDGFTISNSTNFLYYTAASNRKLSFAAAGSSQKWKVSAKTSPLITGGIVLKAITGDSSNYTISENSTATGAIRGYANTTEYRAIYLFKKVNE